MSAPEETGRRRWNRRALRRTGRKNKEAVLSQEQVIPVPDPPCQENITLLECPLRFFNWMPVPDTSGRAMPFRQIPKCPAVKPVCEHCLYPCPSGTCTNQSCQVVSVLQTCELVTDPESDVFGCPQFRACPKCHSLIMHVGGCNYVECGQCEHEYCFICLRSADECNDEDFFPCCSLTHQAARQRFRT
ncbi:uncharacterized protein LOC134303596 [Trichomycterus rosablanca]|uniref:uncharacterized protein LOC134303596 n=1 Tax=Trichomycterus rosablanca TaxID=2290929 RepID=UPI002F353A7B